MDAAPAIVALRGISKAYAGVCALEGVDLELARGEVHALVGENGAGKSTLMKILGGIVARDAGTLLVDGRPVEIPDPRAAQAAGICIVHQELNLMNHLTAAQNIFIGREPRGRLGLFLDEAKLDRAAARLFERIHLRLDPRAVVGDLTVARQQMVEIAKALSFESRVLVMDEPTAALNPREVDDLFRVIDQLRADGVAIVYISHKMDELQRIADRVTVLRDGRRIATQAMADTDLPAIISMMVGRQLEAFERRASAPTSNDVVLDVRGLTRGHAIRDVSFTLRRGEILGFAGLMGAGRTEVARAVFGADPIDAGEIRVRGVPVRIRTPRHAVAHGIGYLSEDRKRFGLATGLDVATNITLASMPSMVRAGGLLDRAAIRAAADTFVRRLAIKTPSIEQAVRLLSGGNQQKIVIAKWLLRDCDILFFDEPTRGIDVGAKAEIYRLLEALADEGKAIVVISSELPEILRLAHRVLVMCEGRVTGELAPADATQEAIMRLATRRDVALAA